MSDNTENKNTDTVLDEQASLPRPCFHPQPPPSKTDSSEEIDVPLPAEGEEKVLEYWAAFSSERMTKKVMKRMQEEISPFLTQFLENEKVPVNEYFSPWLQKKEDTCILWETSTGDTTAAFNIIAAIGPYGTEKMSFFPVLELTNPWLLDIQEFSAAHGKFEGIVVARAASGHRFGLFATDFIRYAHDWNQRGLLNVAVSALAFRMEVFPAKPWVCTEGPRFEEEKARLRREGKHKEADELKSVSFPTDKLRGMNASRDIEGDASDIAEIIGRIIRVREVAIDAWKKFSGWLLEIEVLPGKLRTGYVLPVYAFPPALEGYVPKSGDLIQCLAWLQGKFLGKPTPEQAAFQADWKRDLSKA
jgi:hypothetical protein